MKKSELLAELRRNQEIEAQNFEHFDTLGMDDKARLAEVEQCKWELLGDLLEQHIEDSGDESITGFDEESEGDSTPAIDTHKDDETYMPFDTDLGKGFM